MKKLFTFFGIFLLFTVLVGCTSGGDLVVTAPSFVGVSVDNTNPFNGTDYELYYKEKNESTLIEVVLNNPDNLDIRAILINGYSYRSNTFLKGDDLAPNTTTDNGVPCVPNGEEANYISTSKKIYFCMSAGDTLELTEYTVDNIEYFDGSDTKDVRVQSNNEFHLYVYKELPSIVRENYSLTQSSISVDFEVTDEDGVINLNSLVAKIYLGNEEIVSLEKSLNVGYNSVLFNTGILSNTNYEVKIYADYNTDDTTGNHEDVVLFSGGFTTLPTLIPSAVIDNVVVSSNSVAFDINYNDVDNVTVLGGSRVAVFDGETEVTSVGINGSVQGVVFDDLLNSKQYSLKVISNYDLRNGAGVRTEYVLSSALFETTPRQVPVPEIDNVRVEENRILFDLILNDDPLDPIIDISTLYANVYVENVLAKTVQISGPSVELQINDVLSGKDIRVDFLATYDLNDGNGPQTNQIIGSFGRVSLLNSKPEVDVRDIEVTQGYINIDLSVSDVSNTLLGSVRAVLYRVEEVDGVEVEVYIDTQYLSMDSTLATFAHLVQANSNYRVKMIADYNLLDGAGNKNNQILYTQEITSLQPKAPAAEIQDPIITNGGLEFDVVVMDADDTVVPNSLFIYIYKDGVLQDALTQSLVVGINHVEYSNLNSNYTYHFEIEADYDVLDGSELQVQQVLLEQSLTTIAKELPTASIGAIGSTTESITFDVTVVDVDGVIEAGTVYAVLYYNNTPTGLSQLLGVGENLSVSFSGINSQTPYTIKIITDYDLDNGVGIVTAYPMLEFGYTTDAKAEPVAVIENIVPSTDTIRFDVVLTDFDSVLTSDARAVLYIGDTPTGQSIDLNVGYNTGIEFTNVYSDQNYIIYVVADYDLNDNVNVFINERIAFNYTITDPNEMVIGMLYDITVAIESITFSAQITDVSGVVTDELRAYLIEDGLPTGVFIELDDGDNVGESFINLNSDSLYTIEIRTNYDLGDVTGIQTATLDSFSTETSAYTSPNAYISSINETFDSVVFDVTVNDTSNTSTGTYLAILYYNNLPTAQQVVLLEGFNQLLSFDTLYSGVEYEIRIQSIYDLRDGDGVHTEFITTDDFFTTAKEVPRGLAANMDITEDKVYFEFDFIDEDNTLIPGTFTAWLYDKDLVLIDSVALSNEEVFFDLSYMPSNYAFTIRVTSDYDLSTGPSIIEDGVILSLDLTTYVNQVPTVVITDTKINQTDVTFHLNVTDMDSVVIGDLTVDIYDSLDVFIGTTTVTLLNNVEFGNYYDGYVTVPAVTLQAGLLHNLSIVADYNLRDGNLLQADMVIAEAPIIAVYKIIPQAHIYDLVIGTNTIQFDAMIYDEHIAYIGGAQAVLYKDGVAIGTPIPLVIGHNDDRIFNVTVSDADYQIVIMLNYDNLDGNGTITGYVVADEVYHTLAKEVPVASGTVQSTDVDSALLDITVIDNDSVISLPSLVAVIYKDGLPAMLPSIPLVRGLNDDELFAGLLSDTTYEARIFADYDLGDGVNVVTGELIGIITFTTDPKTIPSAEISNIITDKDTITFDLNITDVDSVITGVAPRIEVKLYKNGTYTGVSQTTDLFSDTITFAGVDSGSEFRLDVVVDYDLTNGLPIYADRVLTFTTATTYINEAATAEIAGIVTDHNSMTFNVTVADVDGVIDNNLKAILVLGGVPTGDEIPLFVGPNSGLSFGVASPTLFSIRSYEIRVIADIDWKDGSPIRLETELTNDTALTKETEVPLASVSNYVLTNSTIQFDVNVWDDTETIVSNLEAVLFLNEVDAGFAPQPVIVGDTTVTFTGLDYGVEYEVRIIGDYNDNYGTVTIDDYLIYYELISTLPLIEISEITAEVLEVNFSVNITDTLGILTNQDLTILVYDETDALISTSYLRGDGTGRIPNYTNDYTYSIEIYGNVTGLGSTLISEQELAIPARLEPTVVWGDILVTSSTITTGASIDDSDLVITGQVDAVLYNVVAGTWTEIGRIANITVDGTEQPIVFNSGGPDYLDGTSYVIVLETTVDFNDGTLPTSNYAISSTTYIDLP